MTRSHAISYAAVVASVLLVVLALAVLFRACSVPTEIPSRADGTSAPTPAETRASAAADRGEAAAQALLEQADAKDVQLDSLARMLATERTRTAGVRGAVARARAETDRATEALRAAQSAEAPPPDTVRLVAPGPPPYLAALQTERLASDAALAQCETRAGLSADIAEAQRARSVWAYAAADSALSALSSTRLAYREADVRASGLYADARRYRSQRNAAFVLTGAVMIGCAVAGLTR